MKKRLFILFLAAAMMVVMCGCGGNSATDAQEDQTADTAQEEQAEDTAPGEGQEAGSIDAHNIPYDEIAENYVFELDGKEYALPCSISEFTDAGWYVQPEAIDFELEKNTRTLIYVYTDSSMDTLAFYLDAINLTDGKHKVSDCLVSGITLKNTTACSSLTLKKTGVTIDAASVDKTMKTYEDMEAAYGTNENIYHDADDDTYYNRSWRFSEGHCWGEGINIQASKKDDNTYVTLYYHGPED